MAGDIKCRGMPGSEIAEQSVILMATGIIVFVGIFTIRGVEGTATTRLDMR